jgi:DNA anti-recombination protein RmuC
VTQPPAPSSDLDAIRRILFGADLARIDQAMAEARQSAQARLGELEQRLDRKLDELAQRVTTQLEELSRRQQAHAETVTQLLDQVMAELSRRAEVLGSEARAGLEELRGRVSEIEKKKLSVADFGASLSALGQRFAATGGDEKSGR